MGETDEEETWMRDYDSYFACLPCAGVDEELVNSLKVDSENGKLALTMKVCSLALSHSSPSLIRSLSLSLPPRQYPHLFPVLKKCTVESTRAAMERADSLMAMTHAGDPALPILARASNEFDALIGSLQTSLEMADVS